jgi:hypothetical protein
MVYTCPLCLLDPLSHSLTNFLEKDNTYYFYTCPAKAKLYFDTTSIINHYNGVLSEIPENKKWIWVFDGIGFGLKHLLQIEVAIELSKLISSKFSKNLEKIIIINPSGYISSVYNIIRPFLNNKITSIIEFNYEIKSVNKFNDLLMGNPN